MTNGFVLNHDRSLQIYFFCVKCQAKTDFLKDETNFLITKTRLFKYIENSTSKKNEKKIQIKTLIFFIFLLKT